MGLADRDYERWEDDEATGLGARFRRAMRRIFVEGDGVLSWALPLFRVAGVRVRVHLFFIVYIVFELASSIPRSGFGFSHTAMYLSILFGLVLLHEFGHVFACRRVGGEADEVLLWPLGGLAMCRPPEGWRAELITTLGGPGVNFVLAPVFAGALVVWGAPLGVVVFNPLSLGGAYWDPWFNGAAIWFKHALWWCHYLNLVLLLFNMLVPMYPMDGGRVVRALIWRRAGEYTATRTAANIGLVVAVTLAIGALVVDKTMLLGIAILGGLVCYAERKQQEFLERPEPYLRSLGPDADERPRADRDEKRSAKAARAAAAEQAEVDRILSKVSMTGIDSLTRAERSALKKATERSRKGAG